MIDCKICGKEFGKSGGLHGHLKKSHSMPQKDYYYYWFPRLDLGDGSMIEYKNYEQYFSSSFNSRLTLADWCQEEKNNADVKEYIKDVLKKKKDSGYKFYPSQSEIKSMMLPSYNYIFKIFGNAEKFFNETKHIGLEQKFDYSFDIFNLDLSEMSIIVDSREQLPLFSSSEVKVTKLPVGDYCCVGAMYSGVYIERKSLMDLAGTLTSGIERFEREIEKAATLGLYLIVVCDESHRSCVEYSPSNSYAKKVTGAHLMHSIRHLGQKYDNIQFVFCVNRIASRELINTIFRLGEKAKTLDIEFLKDNRKI
jgi:ERCC4 domain